MRAWLMFVAMVTCVAVSPHGFVQSGAPPLNTVDAVVTHTMATRRIPGAAVAVLRGETLLYIAGHGTADRERGREVRPDTVFQIASLTKPFTAMALLMLVEEGKLKLDDTAAQYLAWLPMRYSSITLRQLLTHTSGIHPDMRRANVDEMDVGEFRRRLQEHERAFPPGTAIAYANAGYALLSWVVEEVSGEEFGAFLRRRIFAPLGMTTTAYRVPQQSDALHARGYELVEGQLVAAPHVFSGWGNSGIESSVADLAKWAAAIERRALLKPESYALMFSPSTLANGATAVFNRGTSRMGLSWFLTLHRGAELITHGGAIAGFSSIYDRYPREGWTVIVLSNGKQGADRLGQAEAIARRVAQSLSIGQQPTGARSDLLRDEIQALHDAMTAAFATNPSSVARFYADDAQIVTGGRSFVGRQQIDKYWADIAPGGHWTVTIHETGGDRQEPWVRGRSVLIEGDRRTETEYVGLLKRDAEGELKFYVDMYVRAPP